MSEIIEDIKYRYGTPDYNYLNYIQTPGDKGVSGDGSISQSLKNTMAMPYWLEKLTLGWGGSGTQNYKKGKGSYNTGGKLGNKYKIQTGWCQKKIGSKVKWVPRWTWVDNIPNGKVPVYNAFTKKIINIPTPFYGLSPGLLQDVGTINPVAIFQAASGKGSMLGECFNNYKISENNNSLNLLKRFICDYIFLIIILLIVILIYLYKIKKI